MGILKRFQKKKEAVPYHQRRTPRFSQRLSADALRAAFGGSGDFDSREIWLGGDRDNPATLCYLDGLVSGINMGSLILRPLGDPLRFPRGLSREESLRRVLAGGACTAACRLRDNLDEAVQDMAAGFAVLIFEDLERALSFELRTMENRAVTEVKDEKSLKGAKDGFVEVLRTNTALVRKKLRNPDLRIREQIVGRKTATRVAIIYIEGLTDPALVEKVSRRMEEIDIQGVLTTGSLEEYLVDRPQSPFPQLLYTQRPDKFALNLLEGRVGILADGLPHGFLAPGSIAQFMKAVGDDSLHWLVSSAVTFLRWLAFVLSLLLPALYVTVAAYHQEMIPTKLLLAIIASKADVPFSTAVEVIAMLIAFELLQEAGLRLPAAIGQTVSIIGALIVGQSAVEARIVSPVVVIVVALAGIAGCTMPNQDMAGALRICRFLLVLPAIFMGMFGLVLGIVLLLRHLAGLESFGVPYLSPFVGADGGKGLLQALFRPPMERKKIREAALRVRDVRNQK